MQSRYTRICVSWAGWAGRHCLKDNTHGVKIKRARAYCTHWRNCITAALKKNSKGRGMFLTPFSGGLCFPAWAVSHSCRALEEPDCLFFPLLLHFSICLSKSLIYDKKVRRPEKKKHAHTALSPKTQQHTPIIASNVMSFQKTGNRICSPLAETWLIILTLWETISDVCGGGCELINLQRRHPP